MITNSQKGEISPIIAIILVLMALVLCIVVALLFDHYFGDGMPVSQGVVSNSVIVEINGDNVTLIDYSNLYSIGAVYVIYPSVDIQQGDSIAIYKNIAGYDVFINRKVSYTFSRYKFVGSCGISIEYGWNYYILLPEIQTLVTEWQNDLSD